MITNADLCHQLDTASTALGLVLDWLTRVDEDQMQDAGTQLQEVEYTRGYLTVILGALDSIRESFHSPTYDAVTESNFDDIVQQLIQQGLVEEFDSPNGPMYRITKRQENPS